MRGWIAAAFLASGLAGCGTYRAPAAPVFAAASHDPAAVTVYVANNGFHSGLVAPTAALLARPGPTAGAVRRLPPSRWTSIGYGDDKFYRQQGFSLARALDLVRAALWPFNVSTVQVFTVRDPLNDANEPRVLRLAIPPARFDALVRRIDATFDAPGGRPRLTATGAGGDLFFAGRERANGAHECNHWVGQVLGAAGVPHSYVLDTTAGGLAWDLLGSRRAVRATGVSGR